MLVLRHIAGVLRLGPYLREIVLDDPQWVWDDSIDIYSQAFGALKASARATGLSHIPIVRRECTAGCKCASAYRTMGEEEIVRLFLP